MHRYAERAKGEDSYCVHVPLQQKDRAQLDNEDTKVMEKLNKIKQFTSIAAK